MIRQLTLLSAILVLGFIAFGSRAAAAEPVKVGILGFDNYQAVEYVAFFNNPKAEGDLAGLRVVAAYPVVSADYPESAALTKGAQVTVVGYVDTGLMSKEIRATRVIVAADAKSTTNNPL